MLRLLRRRQIPYLAALTKADLLTPAELAGSHAVVARQIGQLDGAAPRLPMLSAAFYSGVLQFWRRLINAVKRAPARQLDAETLSALAEARARSEVVVTDPMAGLEARRAINQILATAPDEREAYAARRVRKLAKRKRAGA